MLKFEGTDKIRDIKYEDGYVDKIYYNNSTQLVFTSDKEKTGVDEVLFKGRKLVDVTSYGKCEQNGTPTPDTPVDIVCNNGVLKVSPNLYNSATQVENKYLNDSGTIVNNAKYSYTDFISVTEGEEYTASIFKTEVNAGTLRIHGYDSSKNWVSMLFNLSTSASGLVQGSVTIPAGYAYIRVSWWKDNASKEKQVTKSSSVLPYMPYGQIYTDGTVETIKDSLNNTATTEMLLKVGDYQDEQEILSGAVTRNVGVKVLDGTESWIYYSVSQGNMFRITIVDSVQDDKEALEVLCNSYEVVLYIQRTNGTLSGTLGYYDFINNNYTTLADWKQYLADQYAAGTPVIIVYPLRDPTTEQVLGQQLTIQQGNNTVEVTQASIDDILLKVKYK